MEDRTPYQFIAREPLRIEGVWMMFDYWYGYLVAPHCNWSDHHHTRLSRLWYDQLAVAIKNPG